MSLMGHAFVSLALEPLLLYSANFGYHAYADKTPQVKTTALSTYYSHTTLPEGVIKWIERHSFCKPAASR